jgi:hypothetical protein
MSVNRLVVSTVCIVASSIALLLAVIGCVLKFGYGIDSLPFSLASLALALPSIGVSLWCLYK